MYLGRVVGCVWSTMKNKDLEGQRLLVVQPLTPELTKTGKRLICADSTGAGAGELIYWVRGKESSFPFLPVEVPVDTTIVGIVDEVHVNRAARTEALPEAAAPAVTKPPRKGKR
jgi:ethanolamine utilization protein EutN